MIHQAVTKDALLPRKYHWLKIYSAVSSWDRSCSFFTWPIFSS